MDLNGRIVFAIRMALAATLFTAAGLPLLAYSFMHWPLVTGAIGMGLTVGVTTYAVRKGTSADAEKDKE